MNRFTVVFLICLGFLKTEAQSLQNEIDSLLKAIPITANDTAKARIYRNLYLKLQYEKPDDAITYAKKGLAIVENMNWEKGLTIFNNDIGTFYNNTSNHALAIKHYLQSLETIASLPSEEANIYNNLSIVYTKEEKMQEAATYAQKAIGLATKNNDSLNMASGLISLGIIEKTSQRFAKARNHFENALKINPLSELISKATILNQLAEVETDVIEKRRYLLEAKTIWDVEAPTFLLAISNLMTLAELNLEFLNTVTPLKVSGLELSKPQLMEETKKILHRSIVVSKSANTQQNLMHAYGMLSQLYAIEKVYDSAYYYQNENSNLYESIFSQESKNKIAALESQKEIELRDKEIEFNKLALKNRERQKWFYIGGILSLVIIGSLLFYQSSNRKKTNKKLQQLNTDLDQANKVKTRFFSILNHDLRSPVANLIHFLHLQKNNPELLDDATKDRMQSKTITGAENLLSSMEDILLWSKGQMQNFKPEPKNVSVEQLFEDTKKVFSGYHNIQFEYYNPESIEIFTDENYLKTIIRNLTSNAINVFATIKDPKIIWKAWGNNNTFYLSITDNGPGATKEQFKGLYDDKEVVGIKSGLGLHLIRDLAKAIHCEIEVFSKPEETIITLNFKLNPEFA